MPNQPDFVGDATVIGKWFLDVLPPEAYFAEAEAVRNDFDNDCITYGCTYYDGLYLALAEEYRIPYLHADARLRRSLSGQFPDELWIEHYQSAASRP